MRIPVLLMGVFLFIVSCKKDPDTPPHQDTFTASVNGTAFAPTKIEVLISGSSQPGTRAINVYATDLNGLQLSLHMYGYNGVKSNFNLDQSESSMGSHCSNFCTLFPITLSASKTGSITIISFDKTSYRGGEVITATFQFQTDDAVGKFNITNGHFSVFVPN